MNTKDIDMRLRILQTLTLIATLAAAGWLLGLPVQTQGQLETNCDSPNFGNNCIGGASNKSIRLVTAGVARLVINPDGTTTLPTGSTISAIYPDSICMDSTNKDACVARVAANHLGHYNGTNAQTVTVYNPRTDASNFERFELQWIGNVLRMQYQTSGSGQAARQMGIWSTGTEYLRFDTSG